MLYVKPVTKPSTLDGQSNGNLGPCQLEPTFFNGVGYASLERTTKRAWDAFNITCFAESGWWLTAVSLGDAYRSYESQVRLFTSRYTPTFDAATCKGESVYKWWKGVKWYQLKYTAMAAVPGTSNHGWGLALDVAIYDPNRNDGDKYAGDPVYIQSNELLWAWIQMNAPRFGFSWEAQSEPWHLRYTEGDNIPQKVLDVENWLANA